MSSTACTSAVEVAILIPPIRMRRRPGARAAGGVDDDLAAVDGVPAETHAAEPDIDRRIAGGQEVVQVGRWLPRVVDRQVPVAGDVDMRRVVGRNRYHCRAVGVDTGTGRPSV